MVKKVLLVLLETEDTTMFYPPYGIMYIADALIKAGYDVEIFHEYVSEESLDELYAKAKDCLLVGFSTMTSPKLLEIQKASKHVHDMGIPVAWGGVHASLIPKETLEDESVDFVIQNEGELVLPELCNALANGTSYEEIAGLCYKKDGKIIINPTAGLIKDLDDYTPRWDLVPVEKYIHNGEIVIIESRGCPSRCTYCYNVEFNFRKWRYHSTDYVVKMIKDLQAKHPIKRVQFWSDNFPVNKKRALEIVEKLDMPWGAEIRANYFDEDFIEKVKKTKGESLYIGAESGSDKVLKLLKKDCRVSHIENAVRLATNSGIKTICSFMVGIPGETEEDRNETLDFMHKLLNNYNVDIDGPKFLNPYPGTELYHVSKQQGWIPPKDVAGWSDYSRSNYNLPFMNKKDVKKYDIYRKSLSMISYVNRNKRSKSVLKKGMGMILHPLKIIEDYRIRNKNASFPLEVHAFQLLLKVRNELR
ncbi:MAG: radical SAM protein [Nanoarchaeota archaeon]